MDGKGTSVFMHIRVYVRVYVYIYVFLVGMWADFLRFPAAADVVPSFSSFTLTLSLEFLFLQTLFSRYA